jgi:ribose transport system substrate-binding protein
MVIDFALGGPMKNNRIDMASVRLWLESLRLFQWRLTKSALISLSRGAFFATLICATEAYALTFAVLGKSMDDHNFVAAWRGCDEEARAHGDRCVHIGSRGAATPGLQVRALQQALKSKRFAAMAISVTHSDLIAAEIIEATIPIVTFDSPLNAKDAALSRTYVGTDDLALGRDLARIALRFRPRGGTLCLMTAANDPNLALRVQGVRQQLSGNPHIPEQQRLNGERGWTELARCPWNSADKVDRTMDQVTATLTHLTPDVFLSVGHWPVMNPAAYRRTVTPFRKRLAGKTPIVIVVVGALQPAYRALMDDGLVHGYVSIDFVGMGRLTYLRMKEAQGGKPLPAQSFAPVISVVAP